MTVIEQDDGSVSNALERLALAEQYIAQILRARINERIAVERALGIPDGELRVPGTTLADVVRERFEAAQRTAIVTESTPRPSNMDDLAKSVAKELRKPFRGLRAWAFKHCVHVGRGHWWRYDLTETIFDGLSPESCATLIQALESKAAQNEAGDT